MGGVDLATCKEQLLYELHDPAEYITPDCVLDITDLELMQVERDRVSFHGAKAKPRTATYKVTVGYHDGYIGEGQISYAGINAVAKAQLAAEVVQQRLADRGFSYSEVRVDLIGMSSVHGMGQAGPSPTRCACVSRRERLTARGRRGRGLRSVRCTSTAPGRWRRLRSGGARDPGRAIGAAAARHRRSPSRSGENLIMVRVYDLAHSRAGDKGDTSNISVIAYDEAGWTILLEQLTEERVMQAFAHIAKGPVRRYELPRLRALNFVIERALGERHALARSGRARQVVEQPHADDRAAGATPLAAIAQPAVAQA